MSGWVATSERLPDQETFGPYPVVEVVQQANSQRDKAIQSQRFAELRFFGGDMQRPFWCDPATQQPIENSCWFVSHWRPMAALPPALSQGGSDD